jgi:hypothetical protein
MCAIHSLIVENLDEHLLEDDSFIQEYQIIGYKMMAANIHKIYFKNHSQVVRFLKVDYKNPGAEVDNSGICAIDGGFVLDFAG